MSNRHAGRAAEKQSRQAAKRQTLRLGRQQIRLSDTDRLFDLHVEGKVLAGQPFVMIVANATGRTIVEQLWPDAHWARDYHLDYRAPDLQFAHVSVNKLPDHLAADNPDPSRCTSDALAMAVASALSPFAEHSRVAHYLGDTLQDFRVEVYDVERTPERQALSRTMEVAFLKPGTVFHPASTVRQ